MNNLEIIYSQYDSETVEANKKLPKPCYGNSYGYYCNYNCPTNEGCYEVTMKKWGVCDCKFRPSCHIPRQTIHKQWTDEDPNYICDFKKYFDEDDYPEIIVPEGIIKMNPIKEIEMEKEIEIEIEIERYK